MARLRISAIAFGTIMSAALMMPTCQAAEGTIVRHQGFDDFSQGRFPDGGANIYVSKRGAVQLIPRWDINSDGYLDLLFSQDHNHYECVDALIHWGGKQGYRSLFPAFWPQTVPSYKFVRELDERRKSISSLPSFGGGPVKTEDLNRDGLPEIIFLNVIHNYSVHMPAYVYWGRKEGYSAEHRSELPTLFARDFAIADFNRDGYPDLAFANFGNEIGDRWGYRNHLESYVYWGGPEGYSAERRAALETISAVSCAAGDFNGDGWADLAFANNNLKQRSVFVYLGGEAGFTPERRLQLEGGNPGIVRAGDVNGDDVDDLLISSVDENTAMYLGSKTFRVEEAAVNLPTRGAKDCALADVNHDGRMDVVFALANTADKEGQSFSEVYWGSESGLDLEHKLLLPALRPQAVATADLNGDGFAEIMFANYDDGDTHDVPSYIYWNSAGGFDPSRRTHLQGFGAVGVAAADLDENGGPEVVLANRVSGKVDNHIPSVIFWGNPAHFYSEANATLLPTDGPNSSKIADLNDDGYPDVVFSGGPPCIHWGSAEGFGKSTDLEIEGWAPGVAVGDFNRDGRLDLVFSTFDADPRKPSHAVVLWGSDGGYTKQRSAKIALQADRTASSVSSADLNKDDYLDLIFPCDETLSKQSEIVWGSAKGFGATPSTLLVTNGVSAPAVADLDDDGWLDIVFPGNMNLDTQDPHTKSLIYWGSREGFSDGSRTELEAYTSVESIVADLNRDGHLDIVLSNYKSAQTRSLPIFIFWGRGDRQYSDERRTELPAESPCGLQVLDLNQDRHLDLVVHNHIKDGDHSYGAYIYWGGENGYSIDRRDHPPTVGTHYGLGVSPGNLYDRTPEHQYISTLVAIPAGASSLRLDWEGATPHATAIRFQVRAASSPTNLADASWQPITPGEPLSLLGGASHLQYSATLVSPDGGNSPELREVLLRLE